MTYDVNEKSAYGGRPVELYKFVMGTNIWRHNDSDRDITIGAETYKTGYPLTRSEPDLSREEKHSQLKITTALNHPVALLFVTGAPYETVWVTVYRVHVGDSDPVVIWQGKIRGVSWKATKGEATFECYPVDTASGKIGFRQTFGPQCNKQLFTPRCGVSEASCSIDVTISNISTSGYVITAPELASKANQYFRLGELYVPSLGCRMQILDHTGQNATLKMPILGLTVGTACRACAGCDHVWKKADGTDGDCKAKFNNAINFGGWPFVPVKNPYSVSIEG